MGYFIKNHGKTDGPLINYQNKSQRIDPASYYINMGTNSIFGLFTMFHSDGHGGSQSVKDDSASAVDNKKKIEELQGAIDTKLKEVNVADIADLSKNITASQEAQLSLQSDIKSLSGEIGQISGNIASKNTELTYLKGFLTGDASKDSATQNKIKALENEIKAEEDKLKELNTKKQEIEEKLKAENLREQKLTEVFKELKSKQEEIENLKKQLSKEEQYDASKETSDLKALTNFTSKPSEETAAALKKAYEESGNNKTLRKGYEEAVKKYPQFFK